LFFTLTNTLQKVDNQSTAKNNFPQIVSFFQEKHAPIPLPLYKPFTKSVSMHSKKKKDQVIILRLTAEEKQRAAKLATKRGATISGLIRSLLEKKEIIEMT